MDWESRYLPPNLLTWQGSYVNKPDEACFSQYIQLLDLKKTLPQKTAEITFAILGFKSDEGIVRDHGRVGTSEAPSLIRSQLAILPLQNFNIHCYDAGDIVCDDHDLEASQTALSEVIALLLKKHIRPIVIGGGHELAWGQFQGIIKVLPPERHLGIINFASHFDMHPLHHNQKGSTSTAFYQIALNDAIHKRRFDYNCIGIQHTGDSKRSFEIAKKYKVNLVFADDLHQGLQEKCFDFVDRVLDENDAIYLSLSLDVFSSAFAPGVNLTQPLGLNPWHIIPYLRQAAASAKIISYDIAEYVPQYDTDTQQTAKLAATLIYEIIHHHKEPLVPSV
jgi:formiminoglutamase